MHDTIICPQCKYEIEVTEVLSSQLRGKLQKEFDAEQRRKDEEFAKKAEDLHKREQALESSKLSIDTEVQSRLIKERARVDQEAAAKARETVAVELKEQQDELAETRTKLQEAQKAELDVRKRARELEEQKRELDLTVARQMDEERQKIRDQAKREVTDERSLKEAEKDKVIDDLRKQITDWQRKAEQGSQQAQGEVLELEQEDILRRTFPFDTIEPVPKGIHGGDVLQRVHDTSGLDCGLILWESKRTKAWSDSWLPKLRDDQRTAKAQISILVTVELPKGISTFGYVDGVWITNRACALGLVAALRAGLIEVAGAKRSLEGRQEKMEILYKYLSGAEFRHRVQGVVEAFVTLREDLEGEKRAMQRIWASRVGRYASNRLASLVGGSTPSLTISREPFL